MQNDFATGSWTASYSGYNGTLTIGPYQFPNTGGNTFQQGSVTYPYQPTIGTGPTIGQWPGTINVGPMSDPEPSEEMIKIATKLLHDPDFEVGKFLARILAKHLMDNIDKYYEDEVAKKYLPEK